MALGCKDRLQLGTPALGVEEVGRCAGIPTSLSQHSADCRAGCDRSPHFCGFLTLWSSPAPTSPFPSACVFV